ncbi:HalOD1 output domain-containing protein [Natrialbaceae archaeon A-gly3]
MTELLSRCDCTPVCRTSYDHEDTRVSSAVIQAIATARETTPSEMEPLYNVIDLEALDKIVEHANAKDRNGSLSMRFLIDGLEVNVCADGEVVVCDSTENCE